MPYRVPSNAVDPTTRNTAIIADLDPVMQEKVRELIKNLIDVGIRILLTSGFRSASEQNALYAQGRTTPGNIVTNAKGTDSFHTWSIAVDFEPLDQQGNPIDDPRLYQIVIATAKNLGFEAGADWPSFPDKRHLQFTQGHDLAYFKSGHKLVPLNAPPSIGSLNKEIEEISKLIYRSLHEDRKVLLQEKLKVLIRARNRLQVRAA